MLIGFEVAKLCKEKQFWFDSTNTDYVDGFFCENIWVGDEETDQLNLETLKEFSMQEEDASRGEYYLRKTQSEVQKLLRDKNINITPPLYYPNVEKYAGTVFPNKNTIFFNTYEECLENILLEALKLVKL